MAASTRPPALWELPSLRNEPALRNGLNHLALAEADQTVVGASVPFFQRWLSDSDTDRPYWRAIDLQRSVGRMRVPTHLGVGWLDIFLNLQLADDLALFSSRSTTTPNTPQPLSCRL